jgi:hypothetical protein
MSSPTLLSNYQDAYEPLKDWFRTNIEDNATSKKLAKDQEYKNQLLTMQKQNQHNNQVSQSRNYALKMRELGQKEDSIANAKVTKQKAYDWAKSKGYIKDGIDSPDLLAYLGKAGYKTEKKPTWTDEQIEKAKLAEQFKKNGYGNNYIKSITGIDYSKSQDDTPSYDKESINGKTYMRKKGTTDWFESNLPQAQEDTVDRIKKLKYLNRTDEEISKMIPQYKIPQKKDEKIDPYKVANTDTSGFDEAYNSIKNFATKRFGIDTTYSMSDNAKTLFGHIVKNKLRNDTKIAEYKSNPELFFGGSKGVDAWLSNNGLVKSWISEFLPFGDKGIEASKTGNILLDVLSRIKSGQRVSPKDYEILDRYGLMPEEMR